MTPYSLDLLQFHSDFPAIDDLEPRIDLPSVLRLLDRVADHDSSIGCAPGSATAQQCDNPTADPIWDRFFFAIVDGLSRLLPRGKNADSPLVRWYDGAMVRW